MADLSVVIPVYNEGESLQELYETLSKALKGLDRVYEVIFVDDGSTDGSYGILMRLHEKDGSVKVVKLRRNFGQTAAMDAGFRRASGKVVVSMDADLQNDPEDIPRLLGKLEEGFDVVCGWRYDRKDPLSKRIPSAFSNLLRNVLTGEEIHDSGCSLRAYRRSALADLELYGEMHRYIPTLMAWKGYKIGEIKVMHHPRKHGRTKYGAGRLFRGLLDLITVKFLLTYASRPLHLFGIPGLLSAAAGIAITLYMVYVRLVVGEPIGGRPLLILGVLLAVLGVQFVSLGLLGELVTSRRVVASGGRDGADYRVEEILG